MSRSKWPFAIESGRVQGKNNDSGWKLSTGKSERKWKTNVSFENKFDSPPEVFLAFSLLDLVADSDYRVCTVAKKITKKGFRLVIYTWRESVVWSSAVTWIAYDAQKASQAGVMITSGEEKFGPKTKGYTLHEDEEDRSCKIPVAFTNKFASNPVVLTGFSMLDVLIHSDTRIASQPSGVTYTGFDAVLSTWNDSGVWGAHVSWIAIDRDLCTKVGIGGRIQTGYHKFQKSDPGYQLHKGEGSRELRHQMKYTKNFIAKPTVVAFFSALDVVVESDRDLRVSAESHNATISGCELKLGTWHNTHVFSATVAYLAYGDAEHNSSSKTNTTTTTTTKPSPPASPTTTTTTATKTKATSSPSSSPAAQHVAKKQKTSSDTAVATKKDSSESDEDENLCKICFDAKINTCIIPCGHIALCYDCSQQLIQANKKQCPICQAPFVQIVKCFKS